MWAHGSEESIQRDPTRSAALSYRARYLRVTIYPTQRLRRVSVHSSTTTHHTPPRRAGRRHPTPHDHLSASCSRLATSCLSSTHSDHVAVHGTVARCPALRHNIPLSLACKLWPMSPSIQLPMPLFLLGSVRCALRTLRRQHTPEPRSMVSMGCLHVWRCASVETLGSCVGKTGSDLNPNHLLVSVSRPTASRSCRRPSD